MTVTDYKGVAQKHFQWTINIIHLKLALSPLIFLLQLFFNGDKQIRFEISEQVLKKYKLTLRNAAKNFRAQ